MFVKPKFGFEEKVRLKYMEMCLDSFIGKRGGILGRPPSALVEGSVHYLAIADMSTYIGGLKRFDQGKNPLDLLSLIKVRSGFQTNVNSYSYCVIYNAMSLHSMRVGEVGLPRSGRSLPVRHCWGSPDGMYA
jgi:hypothetical protein